MRVTGRRAAGAAAVLHRSLDPVKEPCAADRLSADMPAARRPAMAAEEVPTPC
jgi:hypothetical protein